MCEPTSMTVQIISSLNDSMYTAKYVSLNRAVGSQGTNQKSAADQSINQSGRPDDGHAPLQHGQPFNQSINQLINHIPVSWYLQQLHTVSSLTASVI